MIKMRFDSKNTREAGAEGYRICTIIIKHLLLAKSLNYLSEVNCVQQVLIMLLIRGFKNHSSNMMA